ncbi:MAG: hypothetical protein LBU38_04570 [Propionibacteriaceae bacterium]|nr:hypothetical protein [Propionibacteriaceae bacterium]
MIILETTQADSQGWGTIAFIVILVLVAIAVVVSLIMGSVVRRIKRGAVASLRQLNDDRKAAPGVSVSNETLRQRKLQDRSLSDEEYDKVLAREAREAAGHLGSDAVGGALSKIIGGAIDAAKKD